MVKDLEITKVVFLFHKENNDLFAYFQEEIADAGHNRMSYSHIGQHSSCSEEYAKESIEATKEQYQDLFVELESIGYNLEVLNKPQKK